MKRDRPTKTSGNDNSPAELRIIGGDLRRRRLEYSGDIRTRPMKDRIREAVFNLLGDDVEQKFAIDLFAGTGALGLEAISRRAASALFIERHFPTAKVIEQNAQSLNIAEKCRVLPGSAFVWSRRIDAPGDRPWLVFCSPPYEFYVSRIAEMLDLLGRIAAAAPARSIFVVESDDRFDLATLMQPRAWDSRIYPPAVISILRTL